MSSFCVSTDETHSSKQAIFFSFQTEWQNESYLTQWHTKGFQNIKLVSLYSKSVSRENSKCLHFASVLMKHIVQNRPFFSHSKQNEEKWVIFDTMAYQRLQEYQVSFPLFRVSELWKFQMSSFCVRTVETHNSKQAIFFLIPNRMTKWVIFDTMAYQRLPKYQISFPLFKVSEPWKFQMSSFCVSTGETDSPKQAFFLVSKRMKKIVIFDAMGYQRLPEYQIPLPLFKVNEPWKFQMSSFCISIGWNTVENGPYWLFVSPVLMQNDDI